jgi:hypothetical protein
MIISVLFPAEEVFIARLALFLALIVPKLRWESNDLLGLVALCLSVFWKPLIHSYEPHISHASRTAVYRNSLP